MADRHLFGAGAAVCAVCCAPPVLAAVGIVGGVAMVATAVFAGLAFAVLVGVATLAVAWRRRQTQSCDVSNGPVKLELTSRVEVRR